MQILINGKEIALKVSMWVVDENRYQKMLSERPDSKLWETAALLFICYQNACRYAKIKPEFTTEDFELYVDECYSSKEGKAQLLKVTEEITSAILELSEGAKVEDATEEKKIIGEASGNLHLANAV